MVRKELPLFCANEGVTSYNKAFRMEIREYCLWNVKLRMHIINLSHPSVLGACIHCYLDDVLASSHFYNNYSTSYTAVVQILIISKGRLRSAGKALAHARARFAAEHPISSRCDVLIKSASHWTAP